MSAIKLLEQIDAVLGAGDVKKADFVVDDELFGRMLEFIGMLDPDKLEDDQVEELWGIIDALEPYDDEEVETEEEVSEKRFLKKTTRKARRKAKIYRRKNKTKIKAWRRKMKHKLKRAKKTGRGLSGKKRGKTRRRVGPPS